mmetsp:Transcript_55655/g.102987  ORF Transcript_55655/g.102987 Transcript_55655/m.102987 type:complete len:200 (+) Transcript_55655:897-1496(+)
MYDATPRCLTMACTWRSADILLKTKLERNLSYFFTAEGPCLFGVGGAACPPKVAMYLSMLPFKESCCSFGWSSSTPCLSAEAISLAGHTTCFSRMSTASGEPRPNVSNATQGSSGCIALTAAGPSRLSFLSAALMLTLTTLGAMFVSCSSLSWPDPSTSPSIPLPVGASARGGSGRNWLTACNAVRVKRPSQMTPTAKL